MLAVCLHRWIHYGFAFYLVNGSTMLMSITRNSEDPVVSGREQWIPTLSREARQKSVTTSWDCFPTLCWLDFFFFFFGLLFIPMQWLSKHFFIFFPKQTGANWICWLGVCYVGEHELDDALVGGAERSPWCSSPCRCTLRGPVSLLNDAGHHRTVLFNLKSAGFKALCWQ